MRIISLIYFYLKIIDCAWSIFKTSHLRFQSFHYFTGGILLSIFCSDPLIFLFVNKRTCYSMFQCFNVLIFNFCGRVISPPITKIYLSISPEFSDIFGCCSFVDQFFFFWHQVLQEVL